MQRKTVGEKVEAQELLSTCENKELKYQAEELKIQFKGMEDHNTHGAIIRSKTIWVEEGEKSTSYFFCIFATVCITLFWYSVFFKWYLDKQIPYIAPLLDTTGSKCLPSIQDMASHWLLLVMRDDVSPLRG